MKWLTRAVSVGVIGAVLLALVLLLRAKMPQTRVGGHFTAWALFHDGSRLAVGSPVMIAGVHVGEVARLRVVGDYARVDLNLEDDVQIPSDAWITKRAESAFGNHYLEIVVPLPEPGAPPERMLKSGDQLVHAEEGGSTDTALRAVARTLPKIDQGLDTVHDFALHGREWANATLEPAILRADRWLADGHIDKPIASAADSMAGFDNRMQRAEDAVASAQPDVAHALDRYLRAVINARGQIEDANKSFKEGMAKARDGMDRVDEPIQNLADITAAVDQGNGGEDWKGTLARLVNSPHTYEQIEGFTEDMQGVTANFNRFRSWLGLRGEWDVFSNQPNVYLTAELRARHDTFALIELEKGGLGSVPADQLSEVINAPQYNRYQQISDSLRYTAEFGKTLFGHLQLRGGIKESTFGLGADVLLNHGRLRLESDLFGSFDKTPRLKIGASIAVFRSIYILAGVDDVLNKPGYVQILGGTTPVPQQFDNLRFGRDYFFGAGLHFDDADLATLIRVYGAMIVGLLGK